MFIIANKICDYEAAESEHLCYIMDLTIESQSADIKIP